MNDQTDRVRRHTPAEVNRRIDNVTVARLSDCAASPAQTDQRLKAEIVRLEGAPAAGIDQRLHALDAEWDIKRLLQTNASLIVLLGLALATAVNRKFLVLAAGVFGFFGQVPAEDAVPASERVRAILSSVDKQEFLMMRPPKNPLTPLLTLAVRPGPCAVAPSASASR